MSMSNIYLKPHDRAIAFPNCRYHSGGYIQQRFGYVYLQICCWDYHLLDTRVRPLVCTVRYF